MSTELTSPEGKNLPKAEIAKIATTINFDDPALSVTYGAKAMGDIAKFADGLLSRVRSRDAGFVGETLSNLLGQVKELDVSDLASGKSSALSKLPLIGSLFNKVERSIEKFNTVAEQVDNIANKLDVAMHGLLVDIQVLEQLYAHNLSFYDDLSLCIAAGQERLAIARNEDLPKLQKQAEESSDTMQAQKVKDFAEKLNRFERRLHDLQVSRTVTLQTAPQIRLIQSNNQTLAEKIQTSILSTLPIWKSQMVLALSLHGQMNASKLQKAVSDTTNELLKKNAEMLEKGTVTIATEVERSIVDIETLREVHGKLLSTIEETLRISEEGRGKRIAVEKELVHMEKDLRDRLAGLASKSANAKLEQAAGNLPLDK